jgi:hypothetical protein
VDALASQRVPIGPAVFDLDADAVAASMQAVRRVWRYEEPDEVPASVRRGNALE